MDEENKNIDNNSQKHNVNSKPTNSASKMIPNLSHAVKQMNSAQDTIPNLSLAMKQMNSAQDTIPNLSHAIKQMNLSKQALSNFNSNWVLSPTVIEQISPAFDKIKVAKMFSKISKDDYMLSSVYAAEKDRIEQVIEHKESKKSMPVEEFGDSVPLTDIIESLTADEVFEFYNHLVEFPLLGLEHQVGRKIFEEIGKVPLQEFKNIYVYRARERNPNQRAAPFAAKEMFQAPHGMAGNGRFNVTGHGELYTCSSKEVAFEEVRPENASNVCDIIGWELVTPVELLDLSAYDSPLVQYSSIGVYTDHKQEYLISNFLSQCLKFHKINGIRYKSVVNEEEDNFVFFDFEHKWFKRIYLKPDVSNISNL